MAFSPEGRGGNEVSEQPEQGQCTSSDLLTDLPTVFCANKRETELFFFLNGRRGCFTGGFPCCVCSGVVLPCPLGWGCAGWLGRDSRRGGSGERSPLSKCRAGFGMCCCVLLSSVQLCPPPQFAFFHFLHFIFLEAAARPGSPQLGACPGLSCSRGSSCVAERSSFMALFPEHGKPWRVVRRRRRWLSLGSHHRVHPSGPTCQELWCLCSAPGRYHVCCG